MPLKIPYYEMDIPRLVTALADWLACLLYLRFLPPRYGGVKRAALCGGALALLALYLVATDGFDGWRFNVLYAVSVALMLLFMAAATRADRWQVGYFCTRAFILAGFAGALTWQMYVYFARYIAVLQNLLEDYRPVYDIIFLDVEMLHLDGMETARRIRELDSDVLLIFITNMAQYAIKGYAVGALDYVLKPVPYFAFSQQLQKAVNQLAKRTRHYLAVPVDGGMRRLDAATIYYIESEGHRVHFYTEDGDFSAPGALKALEEKLAGRLFARCNSGYLVNLAQVSGVQQNTVQVGPHELQISRPKRRAFLAALADYIGGEGA